MVGDLLSSLESSSSDDDGDDEEEDDESLSSLLLSSSLLLVSSSLYIVLFPLSCFWRFAAALFTLFALFFSSLVSFFLFARPLSASLVSFDSTIASFTASSTCGGVLGLPPPDNATEAELTGADVVATPAAAGRGLPHPLTDGTVEMDGDGGCGACTDVPP